MKGNSTKRTILSRLAIMLMVCSSILSTYLYCEKTTNLAYAESTSAKTETKITLDEMVNGKEVVKEYTKKQFLKKFKCSKEKPIIKSYDQDKNLQVEVYYNATDQVGCGIRYKEGKLIGFKIQGVYEAEKKQYDKYSLYPEGESDIDTIASYGSVTKIKKTKKHNLAGKLTQYKVTGFLEDFPERTNLVDVKFTYDKNGKLVQKEASYNSMLYGTCNTYFLYNFNSYGQLTYQYEYVTHGSGESFYSYKSKKSKYPKYEVSIDDDGMLYAVLYIAK